MLSRDDIRHPDGVRPLAETLEFLERTGLVVRDAGGLRIAKERELRDLGFCWFVAALTGWRAHFLRLTDERALAIFDRKEWQGRSICPWTVGRSVWNDPFRKWPLEARGMGPDQCSVALVLTTNRVVLLGPESFSRPLTPPCANARACSEDGCTDALLEEFVSEIEENRLSRQLCILGGPAVGLHVPWTAITHFHSEQGCAKQVATRLLNGYFTLVAGAALGADLLEANCELIRPFETTELDGVVAGKEYILTLEVSTATQDSTKSTNYPRKMVSALALHSWAASVPTSSVARIQVRVSDPDVGHSDTYSAACRALQGLIRFRVVDAPLSRQQSIRQAKWWNPADLESTFDQLVGGVVRTAKEFLRGPSPGDA